MTSRWPALSPAKTGIRGLCPRCGQGHIFNGFLALKPECEACGLDYGFADAATGIAFFVNGFTCALVVALACCWVEIVFSPSLWVHLSISLPLILLAGVLPVRPLKGWLVNSQFFYKARRGKFDPDHARPKTMAPTAKHG